MRPGLLKEDSEGNGDQKPVQVKAHTRIRKLKSTREELYANLPVREVKVDVPKKDRNCADCGVMWPGPLKWIQKDVDRELYNRGLVVTSDSIILDHCASWVNLTAQCPTKDNKSPLQVWE